MVGHSGRPSAPRCERHESHHQSHHQSHHWSHHRSRHRSRHCRVSVYIPARVHQPLEAGSNTCRVSTSRGEPSAVHISAVELCHPLGPALEDDAVQDRLPQP